MATTTAEHPIGDWPPVARQRTAAEAIEQACAELDHGRDETAQVYATLAVALATIEQTEALRARPPGGFSRPEPRGYRHP